MYADHSNMACDILSILPHGVRVEASFSLGPDVIGWRQSKSTGVTLREKVVVQQFASAINESMAGTVPELVLAMVADYPAEDRVRNWTGWSSPGCYPENRGTHRVRGGVGTRPLFHITVPATVGPIKYLGSDRIMT
jgi:hypothetical protein